MQGQRGLIEIHIEVGVVLFTNSIPNRQCFLKMSLVFICHCICSICLNKKLEGNENKIIAYDKAEKIQDHCAWSHVKDSYLIL